MEDIKPWAYFAIKENGEMAGVATAELKEEFYKDFAGYQIMPVRDRSHYKDLCTKHPISQDSAHG